jgi:hypothetical protein
MIGTPVRAVIGAPVTLTYSPVDYTGEPSLVDPGTVTVGVVRSDQTELVAPGTATSVSGVSRTLTLTAAQTAQLDRLTVTWTASAVTVGTTVVDLVGAPYLTVAELRAFEPSLVDATTNPVDRLVRARLEVEDMFERSIGTLAFVPRFGVAQVDNRNGSNVVRLPHYFMRLVRWVKYGPGDGTLYDFDPVELGYVAADPAGIATLNPGSWPQGRLLVGYEHGMDAPPSEVKRQAALATRRQMNQHKSQVDARATTYQSVEGGTVGLATPGLGPWVTGVPSIDELLKSYRVRYPSMGVG